LLLSFADSLSHYSLHQANSQSGHQEHLMVLVEKQFQDEIFILFSPKRHL